MRPGLGQQSIATRRAGCAGGRRFGLSWRGGLGLYRCIHWIYLHVAIVSEVIGTAALKAAQGFTRGVPTLLVVTGYGISFYFLSLVLRTIPLGVSYAIWSGVGIALVTLAGWFIYDQRLDLPTFLGIGLIIAGVIVINVFGQSAAA